MIKESIANRNLRDRDGYDVSLSFYLATCDPRMTPVVEAKTLREERSLVIKSVNIDDYRLRRT